MTDPTQVPYLLRLLEDPSDVVREAVLRELSDFGPALFDLLLQLETPLSDVSYRALEPVFQRVRATDIRTQWGSWRRGACLYEDTERAMALIVRMQYGPLAPVSLGQVLDRLADEFIATCSAVDSIELAHFLFQRKGLHGARNDYYNPRNSNLVEVLSTSQGLPISLACVYMLTARRCGLSVEGCNFPGHFMARTAIRGHHVLVDCFNRGRLLDEEQIMAAAGYGEADSSGEYPMVADSVSIVRRTLRNLAHSYDRHGDRAHRNLTLELLADLDPSTKVDVP